MYGAKASKDLSVVKVCVGDASSLFAESRQHYIVFKRSRAVKSMQIMTQFDMQAEETAEQAIHVIFIRMYHFLKQSLSCCNKVAMQALTGIRIISNDGGVMVLFQQRSFQQRF